MKRISQSDLQNMYEPVPQHLMDDVDQILSSLDDREERPIVKKKISVSFVLAAVLIIASMAALAAGNLNLFRNMTRMAQPILPLEGAEEMVRTNLGSVENEYVTLTVEEAVYDGQSVMTLVHITPKDTEKYAMLNTSLQNTPEEIYNTETRPVKVPKGGSSWEMDGNQYEFVNEKGAVSFKVNGEETEIPADLKAAEETGLPMYMENGHLYYADQFEFAVTGRKDGRSTIGYWVNMSIVDVDAENAEALGAEPYGSHSMDAEEQSDGSVLVWSDRNIFSSLSGAVKVRVRSGITADGQEMKLDEVIFELERTEAEKKISLIPENSRISKNLEIHSAEISFTKLRGNLTVEYSYIPSVENDTDVILRLYDANGNRITDGSGQTWKVEGDRYRNNMEIQSFAEIPETLVLEAKKIEGDVIGRCVCRVAEAK